MHLLLVIHNITHVSNGLLIVVQNATANHCDAKTEFVLKENKKKLRQLVSYIKTTILISCS